MKLILVLFFYSAQIFANTAGSGREEVKRVPHPDAGKGLIRINEDGSYQYKVATREKSQAYSVRLSQMEPPLITSSTGTANFADMYGSSKQYGLMFDYEWQPFRSFGSLGLLLGAGFSVSVGKGRFANGTEAEESYQLFIFPLSAFISYRFEFSRKQWFVPFVFGGGTYYGMIEKRDDNKQPSFAGAAAVGGGGGLLVSINRWDPENSFILSRDYDVADMWLVGEVRVMKGLKQDIDFTGTTIGAGIVVDF